jgi:hypothetical protein
MHVVHALPAPQKAAFVSAMRTCPDVVERESHPLCFLRHYRYDYWKAAEGLTAHWSERVSLFGAARAYRPMTATGQGALCADDVLSLHTGAYAILPTLSSCSSSSTTTTATTSNSNNRSVLLIDRSRALATATPEARLRAAFYVLCVLSQQQGDRSSILALCLLVSPRTTGLDHDFSHRMYRLMGLFPLQFHMHLLNLLPKTVSSSSSSNNKQQHGTTNGGKHALVQQVITAGLAFCSMYMGGGPDPFQVVTEGSGAAMLSRLTALGLSPSGVPLGLGGKWTYTRFATWCREQATHDALLDQVYRAAHPEAHDTNEDDKSSLPGSSSGVMEVMEDASRKRERMRTVNVIHSRQKRERRKTEERDLKDECAHLQASSRQLRDTNTQLELLLLNAQAIETAVKDGRIVPTVVKPKPPPVWCPPPQHQQTSSSTSLPQALLQGLTQHPPEMQTLALFVLLTQQQHQGQPTLQQQQQQLPPLAQLQSLLKATPPPDASQQHSLAAVLQSYADQLKPPLPQAPPVSQAQPFAALLNAAPQKLAPPLAQAAQQQQSSLAEPLKSPAQAASQPPVDQNALIHVLLSALDQVQKTQALEMNLGKLVQGLFPHVTTPSKAANPSPDSLATLVTLLLLQAQQQN